MSEEVQPVKTDHILDELRAVSEDGHSVVPHVMEGIAARAITEIERLRATVTSLIASDPGASKTVTINLTHLQSTCILEA